MKKLHLSSRRLGFNPWVGKIPWRRKWQSTLVFLPGEYHGQRSLVGYSPQGRKESDTTEATLHACIARLSERLNKIMKMKAFFVSIMLR